MFFCLPIVLLFLRLAVSMLFSSVYPLWCKTPEGCKTLDKVRNLTRRTSNSSCCSYFALKPGPHDSSSHTMRCAAIVLPDRLALAAQALCLT